MANRLTSTVVAGKYAGAATLPPGENSQRTILAGAAYDDSTPPLPVSFLAHVSKPIGRKRLRHELKISKKLLDMWISGERKDPIERVRDIMRIAAAHYPDLPLDIAQDLVEEFGGLVVRRRS